MYPMINYSFDVKCWILFGIFCAIVLTTLCIAAIIEAIAERRERKEELRRACKRHNTAIRPTRRY